MNTVRPIALLLALFAAVLMAEAQRDAILLRQCEVDDSDTIVYCEVTGPGEQVTLLVPATVFEQQKRQGFLKGSRRFKRNFLKGNRRF